MANQIRYQVGFDIQKNGLNQLKSSLQQLQNMKISDLMKINNSDSTEAITTLGKIKAEAANVEDALKKAFNSKLDTVNIETFKQQINRTSGSIENVYKTFKQAGTAGENAFRTLSSQVLNTNVQLKEAHTLLDNMATTLANTIKWNVASSAVNALSGSVQQAFGYVKALDTSLNDIRIVTNKTADDMDVFAEKANKAAQALGKTTTDYTDASLIFYQQGLSDKEVQERARITLETANVTGQSTDEVSEQLTAVWNGYKVSADEAQLYVDRLAAVAAATASDLEELSTGMSKVASAANLMGVGEDQLAAMLSTIISVTREAPETVGSALKTIFARINDIKAGVAEDGVTLGRFSGQMAEYGFNVLDANGHLRDMGDVLEEIGGKWEDLSREQQVSLAQIMGGKYQYSRLLSYFDNFDQYVDTLEIAREAEGTLQEQQDIYMDRTTAHLQTLKAAVENIYNSLLDTNSINSLLDGLTGAANVAASFVDSIGGGGQILQSLGAIGVNVFSQQIAKSINATITNFEISRNRALEFKQTLDTLEQWKSIPGLEKTTQDLLNNRKQLIQLSKVMTNEQFSGAQDVLNNITQLTSKIGSLTQQRQLLNEVAKEVLKTKDAQEALNKAMNDEASQNKILEKLKNLENQYKNISNAIQNYIKKIKSMDANEIDFKQSTNSLKNYLDDLKNLQSQEWVKQHQEQIQALKKSLNDLSRSGFDKELMAAKLSGIATQINALTTVSGKTAKTIREQLTKEFQQTVTSYENRIKELENQLAAARGKFNKDMDNASRTQTIENYAKLAGGIAQVGMSIQQVQNLESIWKNEDLSTGEKLLQTTTNLGMSLPMLATGVKSVIESLELLTAGSKIAMGVVGGVIATITIAMSFLSAYSEKQRQLREDERQLNNETIQKEKQTQAEIENNKELLNSLEQLDQKYKNGQITRNELKSTVQKLIQQYHLEGEAADNLANSYDNLSGYIQEASLKSEKAYKESLERERDAAESNLKLAVQDNNFLNAKGNVTISSSLEGIDENKKIISELKKAGFEFSEVSGDYATGFENQIATIKTNLEDGKDIVEFYEKIQNTIQNIDKLDLGSNILARSDYYKALKDILKDLSDEYKEYKDSAQAAEEAAADFALKNNIKNDKSLDFKNIEDANAYLEKRAALIEKIKQQSPDLDNDTITERVDNFLQENFKDLYDHYNNLTNVLDKFKDQIGGQIPQKIEGLASRLDENQLAAFVKLDPEDFSSWKDLEEILNEISQKDFSNVKDIASMRASAEQKFTYFSSLEEQVNSGKNLSTKEFDELAEKGAAHLQDFFDKAANGTYKMVGDIEEFQKAVESLEFEGFYEVLDAIQEKINAINDANAQHDMESLGSSALTFGFGQSDDVAGPIWGATGFDEEKLLQQIEYLEEAKTISEGQAEVWERLVDRHKEDVGVSQQIVDLCAQMTEKINETANSSENLNNQWHQIQEQIQEALFPLDEDVDTSQLQHLTQLYMDSADQIEGLNDAIKGNKQLAQDAAIAVLRYDDAIQDLITNYEDWVDILQQGSNVEYVQIAEDLADAYADLLDFVGDGALSDEFLRNTENLQLFRIAVGDSADGTEYSVEQIEDAYNRLQDLALNDIVTHLVIEDQQTFYNDLNSIQDQIADWQAQGLNQVDFVANMNNESFINSFNEMLATTDMGVKQANNLIKALGFEATVIESKPRVEEQETTTDFAVPPEYVAQPTEAGDLVTKMVKPPSKQSVTIKSSTVIPGTGAVQVESFDGTTTGGGIKYVQAANGGGSTGSARRTTKREKIADDAAKAAEKERQQAERRQREIDSANRKAQQEADKAQRKAEQDAKKAQQQAQRAQKEWEKENSDTSQKDTKDQMKDERDLYHDINIQIKQIDREFERIQKRQERMYGKDLLKNLDKQTQILEKHKEKLKEKQVIQEYDLKLQIDALKLLGVTFDAYGNISNYMDVVEAKQQRINDLTRQYNDLVTLYNSSTNRTYKQGVADQMEALDKQIQDEKKGLTQLNTAIKDYDSLRDDMQDIIDDIEDDTQKQIEIRIKQFRMELEIRLELGQAERDWNEFRRKVINHTDIIKDSDYDKIFADANTNFQDIMTYFNVGGQKGEIQKLTEQLNDTYSQVMAIKTIGSSSIYGDNMKQAMDDLKEDLGNLQDKLIEIKDLADEIDQAYLDTIDDVLKHFEEQISDYEYVTDLIEHDMDLLDLLYGEKNYEAMDRYYETLKNNHYQELDFLKQESAMLKQQWERAVAEDGAESQTAKKFEQAYKESIVKIKEEIANTAKDLQSQFTNSINAIWDELDKKLTNGKGLEYTELDWQLMNMNADDYLDTINAAYAIQELEGNFRKALNETNLKNVKAQKQIKALMDEQLANLRAKEKLTQYDVDRAQKLLEIEQARIALEDARSSKTSMQLRRDSQGNYSYEYVADQDSIIDAQQNLAAAQNDLYNFDKDAYKANLEDMLNAYKDYQEKHKELSDRAKDGDIEAQAELALLTEEYGQRMNDLVERNQNIRVNLRDSAFGEIAALYDTDVANYQNMSEQEKNILMNDLIPAWDSSIQEMSDKVAGEGGFIPTCEDAFDKIAETTKNYQSDLDSLATAAGVDLEEVRDGVDNVADSFRDLIDENGELIETMGIEIDIVAELRQQAQGLASDYNSAYNEAVRLAQAIHKVIQAEDLQAAAQAAQYNNGGNGGNYDDSSSSSGDSQVFYSDIDEDRSDMLMYGDEGGDGVPSVGDVVTFTGQYYHDSWGKSPAGSKYSGVEGGVVIDDYSSSEYGGKARTTGGFDVHIKSADGLYSDLGWIRLSQLRGYATGGYVGDWAGAAGRLGILHQKEMVLNAKDTENILDSVALIREMMGNLNGSVYSRLGNLRAGIRNPFSNNGDGLEQNVHIDASFPNVDSKREIEEALSDLVDLAAQRAMRR